MDLDRELTLAQHRTLVAALQAALGADTERIETHISTLLLAGEFAYKLRKPIALPFLDFTTLAARAHDCEEELRLNRRTAPQLYLDVRPVRGTLAQPRIGEPDEANGAIDWLLRMRRFDNELLLDRLAARGALGEADVDALARRVADFHAALPASPAAFGDPAGVLAWARANFAALGEVATADLHDWSEREFERIAPRLALRRAQGRVREGHGDLHLGNIVKLDGEPLPFDAIEFNPALRHGDTMSDAAFVFMDLWRHGLRALAWRFASAYAERGGDHEGLALLPFFAVYRALVRAQVAALRHDTAALARDLRTARELTQLCRPRPLLLLTVGLSGSGKSTVALELLQALGAVRVRSDVERKRLAGLAATARPSAQQTAQLYGPAMTQRTYARLNALAATLLQAGLNVIVDAAALRRHERDALRALAAECDADFRLIECVAPEAVLRARIARRQAEDHDASDADQEVLSLQLRICEIPASEEAALRLDTDADPAVVRRRCLALVSRL
ncbi:AAA family ATPase [Piscinibacter sp.]|uniref:bifunctional aminoglycoside phosphotransferase/ATP-binding protein n=1 Tax=Piscinibacter sp. TaxID=1903157 RepID=UPI0037830A5A